MTRALAREGYTLLPFASAEEALDALEGAVDFDLLLTDVVLPGLGGPQLAERVRERCPDVKVLFVTGYARHMTGASLEGAELLEKPYTMEQVLERVRRLLGE